MGHLGIRIKADCRIISFQADSIISLLPRVSRILEFLAFQGETGHRISDRYMHPITGLHGSLLIPQIKPPK